jgi:hypothetical protein
VPEAVGAFLSGEGVEDVFDEVQQRLPGSFDGLYFVMVPLRSQKSAPRPQQA